MRALLSMLGAVLALVSLGQTRPLVQVYGTVTDSVSGKAAYTTVEHYDLAGKRWALTEVNGDGKYALFVPSGEPFELRVTPLPGQRELRRRLAALPPDARTFRLDLRLQPAPDADR
jgi:hypothetical protein